MEPLQAVLLGVVEGITEFLPISSTAHLIITAELLGITQTAFVTSFEIAIQLGAIGAILTLYWRKFLEVQILKRLFVAFIPTAVVGLLVYRFVKSYLFGNLAVIAWALIIGGILMIIFEKFVPSSEKSSEQASLGDKPISLMHCVGIGLFQSIALIPGVSRSAATIIGGLALGISRTSIVEFSFLLAVPTMGAATTLDILKNYELFTVQHVGTLCIGFVVAYGVALIAVRFLLSFVQKYSFVPFGVYRVILGVAVYILLVKGV